MGTQKLFVYGIFGFLLFLIINWLLNEEKNILEGVENKTPAAAPAPAAAGASSAAVKCPADCDSVKELATKLKKAVTEVEKLGPLVSDNMTKSIAHQTAISDMNQSIDEMQKNKSDD